MKICICGSRIIKRYAPIEKALNEFFAEHSDLKMTELISGAAKGVDTLAENFALRNGIPIQRYYADWQKFGIGAGFKRNSQMVDISDAVIAIFPLGLRTNGTMDTVRKGRVKGILVFILEVIP